jgi:replicative DNA helicase
MIGGTRQAVSIQQAVENVVQRAAKAQSAGGRLLGIPSGFKEIDRITLGWQSQDLIVIAARPSIGKTALALDFAKAASKAGVKVYFASVEMSAEQLATRLLSSESGINGRSLRLGRLSDCDWQRIGEACSRITNLEIVIDDTSAITDMQLAQRVRQANPGILVVDYLQLMRSAERAERKDLEIGNITAAMKALAKELDIPIILLSQLNRQVEHRKDPRPRLTDLRESGAIEQDADIVFGIYRDLDRAPQIADLICLKHRNGPIGTVMLTFREELTSFDDLPE